MIMLEAKKSFQRLEIHKQIAALGADIEAHTAKSDYIDLKAKAM